MVWNERYLKYKQMISGEEMHPLITLYIASVMASSMLGMANL